MKKNVSSGFTLLEMIVAVAVFSLAAVLSLSTLISLSNQSRKAQTTRAAMENLGSSIESMSRSIRAGKDFQCDCGSPLVGTLVPNDCLLHGGTGGNPDGSADGPTASTLFIDNMTNGSGHGVSYNNCLAYKEIGGPAQPTIFRLVPPNGNTFGYIQRSTDGGNNYSRFTTPDVNIQRLKFYVAGAESTDAFQPYVVMSIGGTAGTSSTMTSFDVQTMVVPRTPRF